MLSLIHRANIYYTDYMQDTGLGLGCGLGRGCKEEKSLDLAFKEFIFWKGKEDGQILKEPQRQAVWAVPQEEQSAVGFEIGWMVCIQHDSAV